MLGALYFVVLTSTMLPKRKVGGNGGLEFFFVTFPLRSLPECFPTQIPIF